MLFLNGLGLVPLLARDISVVYVLHNSIRVCYLEPHDGSTLIGSLWCGREGTMREMYIYIVKRLKNELMRKVLMIKTQIRILLRRAFRDKMTKSFVTCWQSPVWRGM